ncbi:MAG TPA: hypothetical protein DCQ30_09905 [Acidimicrobiaceae bacterium]|nr:hypothetical protein [Acidimicrobiaceae bacterium]
MPSPSELVLSVDGVPEPDGPASEQRDRSVAATTLWAAAIAALYVGVLVVLLFVGHHVTLPDEAQANAVSSGGLNQTARELVGRGDPSDFLADYASAHALTHGANAYAITSKLARAVGTPWPVSTANPHPPTALVADLPFTLLHYHAALAAWDLAMLFALVATVALLGAPMAMAVPVGLAVGLAFPGAYGITNNVPLIGLGVAMAYRWRNQPALAGLGVTAAAVPKASGVVLVVPFLLAARWRAVGWSALFYGISALIPFGFDDHVWNRYFHAGVAAVNANAGRSDNASLLHLGRAWGVADAGTLVLVALAAAVVSVI